MTGLAALWRSRTVSAYNQRVDAIVKWDPPPSAERFKAIRLELGWKQRHVSVVVDRDVSTLREYERGRKEIPIVVWKALLHARQEELDRRSRQGRNPSAGEAPEFGVLLPVVGLANAGTPAPSLEHVIDEVRVSEEQVPRGRCFVVQIDGRSMEPTLLDGDLVMVAVDEEPADGSVVVVDVPGEGVAVRRLVRGHDGATLVADAEGYQPISPDERDVRINGVVTEIVRRKISRRTKL